MIKGQILNKHARGKTKLYFDSLPPRGAAREIGKEIGHSIMIYRIIEHLIAKRILLFSPAF